MLSSPAQRRVLIVGAGHAGVALAAQLRALGHLGDITLLSQERHLPYQRPPLSKAYLKAQLGADRLPLRSDSFYQSQRIGLSLGVEVTSIDRQARHVTLDNGCRLDYDVLVLATGASPRSLPQSLGSGAALARTLRSLGDADALRQGLRPGGRVLIVGAGYIGLEVAAALKAQEQKVTLVEVQDQVLARMASAEVASHFEQLHRAQGVALHLATHVTALQALSGGQVVADLSNGSQLELDLVVAGVGVQANDALAQAMGLFCAGGVVVDADSRTDDPAIYAIGDCSVRPLPLFGGPRRLESVPSALDQARLAAHHILGLLRPAPEVPWFWTEQFNHRLQTVGLSPGHDRRLLRGDRASGRFAVYYLSGQRLLAVDAVNAQADFQWAKRFVGQTLSDVQLDALVAQRIPADPISMHGG